jgi:hypothetical protein
MVWHCDQSFFFYILDFLKSVFKLKNYQNIIFFIFNINTLKLFKKIFNKNNLIFFKIKNILKNRNFHEKKESLITRSFC